jgi:hydroxymethylbilane synthase
MNATSAPAIILRLGTRGSALALRQADIVAGAIHARRPDVSCEIRVIRTHGDLFPRQPFAEMEGQGTFVREMQDALLRGDIDLAVHSFKDLPTARTEGCDIGALLPRATASDALVSRSRRRLADLLPGTTVGTGSPRRAALLRSLRSDVQVVALRGNVDTRLRRVADGEVDAVVLALAGLQRLGRESEATEILDPSEFTPAVGQGILAIEVRSGDRRLTELVGILDDPSTRACALAERAAARTIAASCHTPLGAYARIVAGRLELSAVLATADAAPLLRVRDRGDPTEAEAIGERAGLALAAAGRAA